MQVCLPLILALWSAGFVQADEHTRQFALPRDSARPRMFTGWMEENAMRESITTDLDVLKRQEIGGLTFSDAAFDNVLGLHWFMSGSWRGLFRQLVKEAAHLRVEMKLKNDSGWTGSGGPWVTPEQVSQPVVRHETILEAPARFNARLPLPTDINDGNCCDIAVLQQERRGDYYSSDATLNERCTNFYVLKLEKPGIGPPIRSGHDETEGVFTEWSNLYLLELQRAGVRGVIPGLTRVKVHMRVREFGSTEERVASLGLLAAAAPSLQFSLHPFEQVHRAGGRLLGAREVPASALVRQVTINFGDNTRRHLSRAIAHLRQHFAPPDAFTAG